MKEINQFIKNSNEILREINKQNILEAIKVIKNCSSKKGRIFFAGSGGGAGHASHATNDFRKICNIESYCITDNVSELSARINDNGWNTSYSEWLKVSNISKKDLLFIFSVGGGNEKKKISMNLIETMKLAKKKGAKIISIVGKKDGYASKTSNVCIQIPNVNSKYTTPLTEGFQAVIWHMIVSHSSLQKNKTKW
tara:strand:- start:899 stop:1483 length:585 start_codon:yes stop_codon:yes gene_type:complete